MTSDPDVKVTTFFEVEYRKKRRVLKTKFYVRLSALTGMVLFFTREERQVELFSKHFHVSSVNLLVTFDTVISLQLSQSII